jgi:hypothetical protein
VSARCCCACCGRGLASKGHSPVTFRSLFGDVPVRVQRLLTCPCQSQGGAKSFTALDFGHDAVAPELAYVTARYAALAPFGKVAVWHGRWPGCRCKLAALSGWTKRKHLHDVAGTDRIQRHVSDLLGYLGRNQDTLVHYAARQRCGEPISTAFVESAVNEIIAKRMNKKQQMRWTVSDVLPPLGWSALHDG